MSVTFGSIGGNVNTKNIIGGNMTITQQENAKAEYEMLCNKLDDMLAKDTPTQPDLITVQQAFKRIQTLGTEFFTMAVNLYRDPLLTVGIALEKLFPINADND